MTHFAEMGIHDMNKLCLAASQPDDKILWEVFFCDDRDTQRAIRRGRDSQRRA